MTPGLLVRLEGLAVFGLAIFLYVRSHQGWLLFALLILAPDLSIPFYFAGRAIGASAYNLVHTYVGPIVLAAFGLAGDHSPVVALALIWIAHIGMDRFLGFGLKCPSVFKDTHIQRL